MFGIFYTLAGLFCKTALDVKNNKKDSEARKSGDTYNDHNGVSRWSANNHPVVYIKNEWGDNVVFDVKDNKVVYNGAQERLNQKNAELIDKGETIVRIDNNKHESMKDLVEGYRYKDLTNGNIYVQRLVSIYDKNGYQGRRYMGLFYMDLNGMLVKLVKKEIKDYNVDKFIKAYNDDRKEKKKKIENGDVFDKRVFYSCSVPGIVEESDFIE